MPQDSGKPKLAHLILTTHTDPPASPCDRWMRQVTDTAQPLSVRLEAAGSLTSQCRNHRVFQTLRSLLDHAGDDLSLRKAIVQGLTEWEDGFLPTMTLVHALSIPGLRATAVETLDRMAPVTGPRESRLLQLPTLKPGASKHYRVSSLPGVCGRDRRLLDYLRQMLQTGNRWERALAASELCGLGEVEMSLAAATDSEPRVRKSLAAALSYFREESGVDVLDRLLEDADPRVARQAAESLARLGFAGTAAAPPEQRGFEWGPLLKELSEFRIGDSQLAAGLPEEMVKAEWLGQPGASEPQIQTLEARIGQPLPPSYRTFLAAANGFEWPSSFIPRMFGADEVDRFHVRNADWAKAYRDTYPALGACLQVSAVGDAAVILLNPRVVDESGEWETYFFANWIPGARRYRSLHAFLEGELDQMCEWRTP